MGGRTSRRFSFAMFGSLLLGLLVAAPAVEAQPPGPASASEEMPDAEREAYWRARAAVAREDVAEARGRLAAANADVSRMRRRNHPRGDARAALFAARDAAHSELADAVQRLEVDLPEEARAAGAPPTWLRE